MSSAEIEELYRAHARRLAGYLMRATGDAEVAADLTAETLAAALVARDRYRPELSAPATWLYGIAAHKLTDWRRRGYAEDRARLGTGARPCCEGGDHGPRAAWTSRSRRPMARRPFPAASTRSL